MGEMEVPADAYYGAQTRRAELNFPISPLRMPRADDPRPGPDQEVRRAGQLRPRPARRRARRGDHRTPPRPSPTGSYDDQFVVDVFQTGSGTSTNMNTNEVIAGIANETLTGTRGGKSPVHPNDHVNMGQSSNDVLPHAPSTSRPWRRSSTT